MDETSNADAALMEQVLYEVKKIVVGQDRFLERVLVALLARGHLLVEGVPGLAKTLTVNTLADVVGGTFKRIQFTPDLVPADLVGTRIYNQKTGDFSTLLGPVFCNLPTYQFVPPEESIIDPPTRIFPSRSSPSAITYR